jgi:large subunit ribosomal protein L28
MSKVCEVTGRRPVAGQRVSHANNKTKRWFKPNLQDKRFFLPSENRWVRLRVSAAAIKTIDKLGIERVVADLRKQGRKI